MVNRLTSSTSLLWQVKSVPVLPFADIILALEFFNLFIYHTLVKIYNQKISKSTK